MYKNLIEAYSIVNTNLIESYNINYFDKFLIINLEKDKKRLQDTIKTLMKIGVDSNKIVRVGAVYERWNGHLGCGKSHILALEYAIKNNLNNVVILEDDFEFIEKENVNNLINLFIQNFNNWDVLDFSPMNKTVNSTNIPEISRLITGTTTTGYVVNKHYFQTLLDNRKEAVKLLQLQTDKYLKTCGNDCKRIQYATNIAIDQYHNKLQKRDLWYTFTKNIGKQRGGSTIMTERFLI